MRRMLISLIMFVVLSISLGCRAPATTTESNTVPPPTDEPAPAEASATEVSQEPVEEPAQERESLRYAIAAADLSTLDPHFTTTFSDRSVVDPVFNGLIRFKPGYSTEFEPDLAEEIPEPEIVDGSQVWTFTLRQGVMCHPGPSNEAYELTAEDVVYSFEKAANPDRSIWNAFYEGMTFEMVDDYTVRINVDPPVSPVLFLPAVADLQGGFIVCKNAVEAMGDEAFKLHPVGTGPFKFESYRPQDRVVLTANDDYFRGPPKLAGIEFIYMPDAPTRELALINGDIDVARGLAEQSWIDKINDTEGLIAVAQGAAESDVLHVNTSVQPLDDIRVRQAIAHAIDRDVFVEFRGADVGPALCSIVHPDFQPGGITCDEAEAAGILFEYDPDRARDLLAEAGYPDGFSLSVVSSENPSQLNQYELLQPLLADIGIELEINVVDHPTSHEQMRANASSLVQYSAYRPNMQVYLELFFHSDSIVVTGEDPQTNFSHYTGSDEMIEQARLETDPDQQIELWKQITIDIMEEVYAIPINMVLMVFGYNDDVDFGHDLVSSPCLCLQVNEATSVSRE